jgi:hypothetical protein
MKTKKEIQIFHQRRKLKRSNKRLWGGMLPLAMTPHNEGIKLVAEMFSSNTWGIMHTNNA